MWASFNRFEIKMTKKEAVSASHQGKCDEDVEFLRNQPHIKRQLKNIPDEKLHDELKEYGAWDESELSNREDNERRIIWIAAGDIADVLN